MMYTTGMQNRNLKYIVLCATQKRENVTWFEIINLIYYFVFLCRVDYKVFWIDTLHA
jgi:hypothetical protein